MIFRDDKKMFTYKYTKNSLAYYSVINEIGAMIETNSKVLIFVVIHNLKLLKCFYYIQFYFNLLLYKFVF